MRQYASDLHLQLRANSLRLEHNPIAPLGDLWLLAENIGYIEDKTHSEHPFWDHVSKHPRILPRFRRVARQPNRHYKSTRSQMYDRGDNDLRASHDFGDNTTDIKEQINETTLRAYLDDEFRALLAYPHIAEAIVKYALPYGSRERVRYITELLSVEPHHQQIKRQSL